MKVQPPAESFHQELSRPSLGLCVCFAYGENLCLCGCLSECLSPGLWRMFSHQAGRENPTFINVSLPNFFSPVSVGSFSMSPRSWWRDVDVPWWPSRQKKTWRRGETLSKWTRFSVFARSVTAEMMETNRARFISISIWCEKTTEMGPKRVLYWAHKGHVVWHPQTESNLERMALV